MRLSALRQGLLVYALTGTVFALGIFVGLTAFRPAAFSRSTNHFPPTGNKIYDALTQWDGQWYMEISARGYDYDPQKHSSVSFFPLYPLLGRAVAAVTGLDVGASLLLVSHVFLIGAIVLLSGYVCDRYADSPPGARAYVVLAFALFPTTLFMRVAYSESLLVFLCVLTLYGIQRRWPAWALAPIIGLATAARSVGVALAGALALYLWKREKSVWTAAGKFTLFAPATFGGLLLYAIYLGLAFGEPLAFAKAQDNWRARPRSLAAEQVLAYLSWEPIWSVYDPSSPVYWRRFGDNPGALCSLQAANPVFFLLGAALVALGAWRGWLNGEETVLGAGLLLIPYFLRGYDMGMMGHGRFVGAAVPVYLALGSLLARWPAAVSGAFLGVLAFFLGLYAAMFAAGYFFV